MRRLGTTRVRRAIEVGMEGSDDLHAFVAYRIELILNILLVLLDAQKGRRIPVQRPMICKVLCC
jgi:hypothetical protein